ncbi:putative toxin-antitoxin system toxin component, PIN family [Mucilaginibacter sp. ZT4R22]|uniref:Toxin-antitoxin system toxin component, PIN family n=1 Tax=Mucilaginibacter pankratovii TaxID=2772110 RepID=A0ABR7WT02_9SPHI|nr:putative toxin-antitoxin system toxin component, PIN family [Mucilaginibacter pankratovii]MBD1365444.1 putative toxin-antitoxin system toxin component, PIN family [Mucilaginibacter pankratovii]
MREINDLIVVIDTNILLVSVSRRSKYNWVYQALLQGRFQLAVTQDILLEYEEKIGIHWNEQAALDVSRSLTELPNVLFTNIHYQLNLITADDDDNKFVDCAFAANADYIITHDHHFNILKTVAFPRIPILDIHQFKQVLEIDD